APALDGGGAARCRTGAVIRLGRSSHSVGERRASPVRRQGRDEASPLGLPTARASSWAGRSMRAARSFLHEPTMLGAAVEEAGERRGEFRLVEQEGVVALVALDLDEAHIGGNRV